VNRENCEWQKRRRQNERPCEPHFCFGRPADDRLQNREHDGQVTDGNCMRVRGNLGAAILEEAADGLEVSQDRVGVTRRDRHRSGIHGLADARVVRMQDEYREDVAEQHAGDDQEYAAKGEQPRCPGTQKIGRRVRQYRSHSAALPPVIFMPAPGKP
jgi:hypothetical protein